MFTDDLKVSSKALFEDLVSGDPVRVKKAADVSSDFTRIMLRDEGQFRRILTMQMARNEDLDRSAETVKPQIVVDLEAPSPAAISVPFSTWPDAWVIRGRRYRVTFHRIQSFRFEADVDDLRTWEMDIRQVISDNAAKDIMAEEDGNFLRAVNLAIVGPNLVVPTSGVVQYATLGPITRDSLIDGLAVLQQTPSNLPPAKILLNHITNLQIMKLDLIEWGGGTQAADFLQNGWSLQRFLNAEWLVTIKKGLVPSGTMYYFAEEKFLGKSYALEDATMYVHHEGPHIDWYIYETIGSTIGNTNAVARVDYSI